VFQERWNERARQSLAGTDQCLGELARYVQPTPVITLIQRVEHPLTASLPLIARAIGEHSGYAERRSSRLWAIRVRMILCVSSSAKTFLSPCLKDDSLSAAISKFGS
jgi:hypothetical protein